MRIYKQLITPLYFQFASSVKQAYIASLDQSTTGTKFTLYLPNGELIDQQIVPHTQISEREGWLEHNPNQIYENVQKSMQIVMQRMDGKIAADQIMGLGLSNQRETVVCWDQQGNPLSNAIVWCDTRTEQICNNFSQRFGTKFTNKTGLPVSTYFTLFKILWMSENVAGLREKVRSGKARFGTIDSWVTYKLTGKYVTDASNASRTYLCDLNTGKWDGQLMSIAELKENNLPEIVKSFERVSPILSGPLKGVTVSCILGDQQASAYAHNLHQNEMKITYGTGCFLLSSIGKKPIFDPSFVTTILNRDENNDVNYGFEVSVEAGGGTLNWANRLGLFQNYAELNDLPASQPGLYFFPSFGSIFSPFWKSNVYGGVVGMSFGTTRQHILKALLDSITFRLYDNIKNEEFRDVKKIIVDGGMSKNKQFMQMQADLFGKEIEVRTLDTCWGVAKGVLSASKTPLKEGKFDTSNYHPGPDRQIHLQTYKKWCAERSRQNRWE